MKKLGLFSVGSSIYDFMVYKYLYIRFIFFFPYQIQYLAAYQHI